MLNKKTDSSQVIKAKETLRALDNKILQEFPFVLVSPTKRICGSVFAFSAKQAEYLLFKGIKRVKEGEVGVIMHHTGCKCWKYKGNLPGV